MEESGTSSDARTLAPDGHASWGDVIAASVVVSLFFFPGMAFGSVFDASYGRACVIVFGPSATSHLELPLLGAVVGGLLGAAIYARLAPYRLGYRWLIVAAIVLAAFALVFYSGEPVEPNLLAPF